MVISKFSFRIFNVQQTLKSYLTLSQSLNFTYVIQTLCFQDIEILFFVTVFETIPVVISHPVMNEDGNDVFNVARLPHYAIQLMILFITISLLSCLLPSIPYLTK